MRVMALASVFLLAVAGNPTLADCDEATLQGRYATEFLFFGDDRGSDEYSPVPVSAFLEFDGDGAVDITEMYAAYYRDGYSNRANIDGFEGSGSYTVARACSGLIELRVDTQLPTSDARDSGIFDIDVRFVLGGRGVVAKNIKGTIRLEDLSDGDNYQLIGTFNAVRSHLGAR
jgi:hypothetical protein